GDQWKKFFGTFSEGAPVVDGSFDKNGMQYGVFSLNQLQAQFKALIERSEARYIGKPKIIAMNNKTAKIEITQESAINYKTSTTQTSTSDDVERRDTGLWLTVTPQVNKEGYITMQVNPTYSDVVPSKLGNAYDPVKRAAQTLVRVKNGQTVVIGGMLKSTENKTVRKVPLLGYIPIIGWLFTSVSSERNNTDLVFFITPTILVD
ncbi:MAG: type II and III secretion system protein, partial [Elusimicrobiales bacterium]|nr:type II and III secretion system protein [Elusimicrobiales bacterium]